MSVSPGEAVENEKVVVIVLLPAWLGVANANPARSTTVPKRNERLLMKELLKHEVFNKNGYGSSNLAVQQPWIPVAFGFLADASRRAEGEPRRRSSVVKTAAQRLHVHRLRLRVESERP